VRGEEESNDRAYGSANHLEHPSGEHRDQGLEDQPDEDRRISEGAPQGSIPLEDLDDQERRSLDGGQTQGERAARQAFGPAHGANGEREKDHRDKGQRGGGRDAHPAVAGHRQVEVPVSLGRIREEIGREMAEHHAHPGDGDGDEDPGTPHQMTLAPV
jgi:hypothetical protein